MEVLLLEDIDKLGFLGDVVDVKPGYARNYLVPQMLATVPTEDAIKAIADEKEKRAEQRRQVREKQEAAYENFVSPAVVIKAKVNEQGHLFGSVTEKDISENLQNQGFEISEDMVKMEHHIKDLGEHVAEVRFAVDLFKSVTVMVIDENAPEEPVEEVVETEETPEQEAGQEEGEPVESAEEKAE